MYKTWVIDGKKVVVVINNHVLVYDYADLSSPPKDIELKKFAQYPDALGGYVEAANTCFGQGPDSSKEEFKFWIAVGVQKEKCYSTQVPAERTYTGNTDRMKGFNNWLVKISYNTSDVTCRITEDAILLKQEVV